jgi:hypothetical protein
MKKITKIEYTAFIPEGKKPEGKYAAMAGAPVGTIEKGVINKDGWIRETLFRGKLEKRSNNSNIFLTVQKIYEGKKKFTFFNTAIIVKEIKLFYDNKGSIVMNDSTQGYTEVSNFLAKQIALVWKIDW